MELSYETYESMSYEQKSQKITKRAIIYLPYYYDEEERYPVFYLMHGGWSNETTWLGTPDQTERFKNVIDHAIANHAGVYGRTAFAIRILSRKETSRTESRKGIPIEDTGLFFFKGNPGEKFAICNAGGGFVYVGAMHDSFPHALELSKKGYNAFALIYRPGAVIMQYTGHGEYGENDPPTYACVGENDGIASWRTMERRLARMSDLGIDTEFHKYPGLGHGFGLGTNTAADGWIEDAVAFWERQMDEGRE